MMQTQNPVGPIGFNAWTKVANQVAASMAMVVRKARTGELRYYFQPTDADMYRITREQYDRHIADPHYTPEPMNMEA